MAKRKVINPKIKAPKVDENQILESRREEQLSILNLTEQKVQDKYLDKNLDRERLKIKLLSGEVLDLKKLEVVCNSLQVYAPRFSNEFYVQIFRLNNWAISKSGLVSEKPHIVGKWTKEVIYGRFSKDVLPALETLNPYERIGLRRFKHHQYLNDEGLKQLNQYITEAIDLMKSCNEWYEFRIKLFNEYGVPYQLEMKL